MLVDFDVKQQGMDFFTEGSVIMNYGLWIMAKSEHLKLEHLDSFVSYKHSAFHHS